MFKEPYKNEGSLWFKRFLKDCKRISPYIRVKRIRNGFFRVYYKQAYIHEVYKEMPQNGYDHTDNDPRFEKKSFWEKKEDKADLTRQLKNFVEGYWDSLDAVQTRVYMFKHDKEMYTNAVNAYKTIVIK